MQAICVTRKFAVQTIPPPLFSQIVFYSPFIVAWHPICTVGSHHPPFLPLYTVCAKASLPPEAKGEREKVVHDTDSRKELSEGKVRRRRNSPHSLLPPKSESALLCSFPLSCSSEFRFVMHFHFNFSLFFSFCTFHAHHLNPFTALKFKSET